MKPKRIAFLKSDIAKRGGLEKYALRLASYMADQGHIVTFLTTDYIQQDLPELPFEVVNLGNRLAISFLHLLRFDGECKRYLKQHPHDVVFGLDRNFCTQTHYRAGNGVHRVYLERRKEREPWIKSASFSINPLHQLILAMEKKTFEAGELQCLFTNSHMVKEEINACYAVDPKKIVVVHNGVEWYELEKPFNQGLEMRKDVQKQLGLQPDCYQFLFVGHDYERKGLSLLLRTLSAMSQKSWQLSVVGKDRNPERFMAMTKELGIHEKVRFFGAIKEVKTLYSAADTLVIPSLYDPFANVTVEALAMGVSVISSTANGGSEIITRDELGSSFSDLKNSDELLSVLQKAMNAPKTIERAQSIRNAVRHLDFSNQLGKIAQGVV
jgi:UDP-glucose:(heptosyl)LPS alpha-1,3-glucosyltransferase